MNVTGDPLNEPDVAVRLLGPAEGPSVHDPTVAMPEELVTTPAPVTDPAPLATANVTLTPDTGLPFVSVTLTAGAIATALPTTAVCPLDAEFAIAIMAADPAMPVAIRRNVAGGPYRALRNAVGVTPTTRRKTCAK